MRLDSPDSMFETVFHRTATLPSLCYFGMNEHAVLDCAHPIKRDTWVKQRCITPWSPKKKKPKDGVQMCCTDRSSTAMARVTDSELAASRATPACVNCVGPCSWWSLSRRANTDSGGWAVNGFPASLGIRAVACAMVTGDPSQQALASSYVPGRACV